MTFARSVPILNTFRRYIGGTTLYRGIKREGMMRTLLTIAGINPSEGAGIQADIIAAAADGFRAIRAVTDLTAQNITGVTPIITTFNIAE